MSNEDKRKDNKGQLKMTPETIAKLEAGFTNSLTDEECCLYADINPSTLYRYIEKHPHFWERKERLKKKPNIQAKVNWIKKINASDYQASKEWLERKSRNEFSLKQEVDVAWEMKHEHTLEISFTDNENSVS